MGFSAGGHLASFHSNTYTSESKPAFTILAYPVTTLLKGPSHEQTRQNFLRNTDDPEEVAASSPVQLVGPHTPPTWSAGMINYIFVHNFTRRPCMRIIFRSNVMSTL